MAKKKIDFAATVGGVSAEDDFVNGAPDAAKPKEKVTRVNFDIPTDMHMKFKVLAAQRGTSIKQLLIDYIEKELSK